MKKLYVVKIDLDRWYDLYGVLPESAQEAVQAFHVDGRGVDGPLVDGDKRIEVLRKECNDYPDLWSIQEVTGDYVFMRTTAPEAYDGFSTVTVLKGEEAASSDPAFLEHAAKRGQEWRIVATMPRDLYWQQMRYRSGLCCVERLDGQKLEFA